MAAAAVPPTPKPGAPQRLRGAAAVNVTSVSLAAAAPPEGGGKKQGTEELMRSIERSMSKSGAALGGDAGYGGAGNGRGKAPPQEERLSAKLLGK
jgi:hypothetical protein